MGGDSVTSSSVESSATDGSSYDSDSRSSYDSYSRSSYDSYSRSSYDSDSQERSSNPPSSLSEEDSISEMNEKDSTLEVEVESEDDVGRREYLKSVVLEAGRRRSLRVYGEVLRSYEDWQLLIGSLDEIKKKILSYAPGSWMEKVAAIKLDDYDVPEITSLLLVGPKGAGKSRLVNRISRVLGNEKHLPERAQVSYNSSAGEGTLFLQEYAIPRGSNTLCLYDTRSLSNDPSENTKMFMRWMNKGVCNGELVRRNSDSTSLMKTMKHRARRLSGFFLNGDPFGKVRTVNFVVMVVSGLSVLEAMDSSDERKKLYTKRIAKEFNNPLLSFKDDKPAVVVTHGDLLGLSDRVRVRVFLGELLGIHPRTQIFDISDEDDLGTESSIADLLCYCLEHADKNLPRKSAKMMKPLFFGLWLLNLIFCIALMYFCIKVTWPSSRPQSDTPGAWKGMRHLWLGDKF